MPCPECGNAAEVEFTPNGNVWIPSYHRAGIGLNWSDVFGDVTEKELAHVEGVEPRNSLLSRPDRKHSVTPKVTDSTLTALT